MRQTKLRKRAEAAVKNGRGRPLPTPVSSVDLQRLVRELQLHQIELELQNEELKAARLEAEGAREQYCELFEAAPAGYLILDSEGVIIDCNAAAKRMLRSPQALLGQRLDSFVEALDRSRLAMHLEWARECKRAHCEMRLQLPDARKLMVRLDSSPLPSAQCNSLVVLTDMSERQRSQEQLERLNHELESRVAARTAELRAQNQQLQTEMEARSVAENQQRELEARLREGERLQGLGMLAAGIAHDFNNLLVSVVGNADLLLRSKELPESLRTSAAMMRQTGMDAGELTRQLLVFAGQGRMQTSAVRLSELLAESIEMVRSRARAEVRMRLELTEETEPLAVDRAQVQRVILNLLSNAVEAVEGGGEVAVGLRTEQLDAAALARFQHAHAAQPGEFVVLYVEDTGRGIEADKLTRIFEPFFSTKFTGRGLGLATVLGIVQSHNGAIRVRSVPGKGARFDVALPKRSAAAVVQPSSRSPASWRATGSALVIDDDDTVRGVVERQLRALGFGVCAARGGEAGIQAFEQRTPRFDLVLLDWIMPSMSGEQVMGALRRLAPQLPIVLMSGYDAEALGVHDAFVTRIQKPMTLEQLEAAIRKVCGRSFVGC